MQDDELRQLIEAIRAGRASLDGEHETFLEEQLSALLKARYSANDINLSEERIQSNMAQLLAALNEVDSQSRQATSSSRLVFTRRRFRSFAFSFASVMAAVLILLVMRMRGGDRSPLNQAASNRVDRARAGTTHEVELVRAPVGAEVPEGFVDPKGTLHLTYGYEDNSMYVQSHDGGKTFSAPIQLNKGGCGTGMVAVGGERGPKVAYGRDGNIHVVWLVQGPNHAGVWYARSCDGGRSFEPERNLLDTKTDCDSATVTSDRDGNVWVFWLDGRLPTDPKSPLASPIFMTRSSDNGQTFSRNEKVRHDHPGLACACCRLEARVGWDDLLYLSFRSGYQNVRDVYLLKGRKSENNFKAVRVSPDNWTFHG